MGKLKAGKYKKIFADDTKAYSSINSKEDHGKLQQCIHDLVHWTDKWMLKFNSDKCKVLHLGKNNPRYDYYINHKGVPYKLMSTLEEKDLGVIVDPDLSFDIHISKTVSKANKLAGMLLRFITNKSKDIMVPLFKALVRPILEYGNTVWYTCMRKHVNLLENVQRRFTKRIVGAGDLSYEDRLVKFHLPSLEYRRTRGDLIEMYKMTHNFYDPCTTSPLFSLSNSESTRGHSFKLKKKLTSTTKFQMFYTNRIINTWNNLDEETVNVSSVNAFKNRIDKKMKMHMFATNLHNIK